VAASIAHRREEGEVMPVNPRLLQFLTRCEARYTVYPHDDAFSASPAPATCSHRIPDLVRVIALRVGTSPYLLAVLPASSEPAPTRIEELSRRHPLRLADAGELRELFPDCEPGTAPPFGHLYGCTTLIDPCLLEADRIYFQAGNRREVVGMSTEEFLRLAQPKRAESCLHGEPVYQAS
jgi:Ala-tRNA(Pro) deacylase